MRAIIIEEERFAEVRDLMEAAALRQHQNSYLLVLQERYKLTEQETNMLANEMFRSINYEFVRWAQSHGASCVHK
jgi:hypothetical protein